MKTNRLAMIGVLCCLFAASALVVDRGLMAERIEAAGNSDHVHLLYRFLPEDTPVPETYDDVPLRVLLPAFILSELKTVFLVGTQISTRPTEFLQKESFNRGCRHHAEGHGDDAEYATSDK